MEPQPWLEAIISTRTFATLTDCIDMNMKLPRWSPDRMINCAWASRKWLRWNTQLCHQIFCLHLSMVNKIHNIIFNSNRFPNVCKTEKLKLSRKLRPDKAMLCPLWTAWSQSCAATVSTKVIMLLSHGAPSRLTLYSSKVNSSRCWTRFSSPLSRLNSLCMYLRPRLKVTWLDRWRNRVKPSITCQQR